jgi:DNA-binding LytR/AlgR family response regulator
MSAGALTVLAVDDERPQLRDLARLLRASPDVAEVECASSGQEAIVMLSEHRFDALFLDVRMPGLDGLELAAVLRRFADPPALVFVSAYDTTAERALAVRALDYLRKPVSRRRLDEAIARVDDAVRANQSPTEPNGEGDHEVIAVDNLRGGGTRLVTRDSVLYLQARGDYVRVITDEGRFLRRASLSELERRLRPHGFMRIHRQYLANLRRAVELRPQLGGTATLAFPGGLEIPIARRHLAELRRELPS